MNNKSAKIQRQTRIRRNIQIVSDRPRLSVSRSNQYCYAQLIDQKGKTLLGMSDKSMGDKKNDKVSPQDRAKQLGMAIAKLALEKKIKEVVFDKGRFAYHGRIKALAQGAREGGLQF